MRFEYTIANFQKETVKVLKDNAWSILYVILAIIIGLVIFLIVKRFHLTNRIRASLMNPNREFIPMNDKIDTHAKLYLFYVVWCPHSKKAMPQWKRFKQRIQSDRKRFNQLEFEEIDGDNEENSAILKGFNIDAFPLVRLVHNHKTIKFEGKITEDNLLSFVEHFIKFPDDPHNPSGSGSGGGSGLDNNAS